MVGVTRSKVIFKYSKVLWRLNPPFFKAMDGNLRLLDWVPDAGNCLFYGLMLDEDLMGKVKHLRNIATFFAVSKMGTKDMDKDLGNFRYIVFAVSESIQGNTFPTPMCEQ